MLVDELLLPFGIQDDCKTVKTCDNPAQLKTVHKKNGQLQAGTARLIEKNVL
jgi:hypothetical protein